MLALDALYEMLCVWPTANREHRADDCLVGFRRKVVFLSRNPLLLAAVAGDEEPPSEIIKQLEVLFSAILFLVTDAALRLLHSKPKLDLRERLLGGADPFLCRVTSMFSSNPAMIFQVSLVRKRASCQRRII